MTEAYLLSLAQSALTVTLLLAAPSLIISLVVGVIVSLIQAATSINEVTMNFIPKLIGVCAVILVLGSWMLQQLLAFTSNLFSSLPNFVR